MTKVKCSLTGCKYNSSCCTSPSDSIECFCTKQNINLVIDEYEFNCENFEEDYSKEVECTKCQILKYGGIRLDRINNLFFEENND